eukprot:351002-Chlamydomonas_euryale.AAC.2
MLSAALDLWLGSSEGWRSNASRRPSQLSTCASRIALWAGWCKCVRRAAIGGWNLASGTGASSTGSDVELPCHAFLS